MQTFGDPEAARLSLPGYTITIEAELPWYEVLHTIATRIKCRINLLSLPATRRSLSTFSCAKHRRSGSHGVPVSRMPSLRFCHWHTALWRR